MPNEPLDEIPTETLPEYIRTFNYVVLIDITQFLLAFSLDKLIDICGCHCVENLLVKLH